MFLLIATINTTITATEIVELAIFQGADLAGEKMFLEKATGAAQDMDFLMQEVETEAEAESPIRNMLAFMLFFVAARDRKEILSSQSEHAKIHALKRKNDA